MLKMKIIIRLLCCTFMLMCICRQAIAQDIKASGRVINQKTNEALYGASVTVKGTKLVTTTDQAGNFEINVPNNRAVLVISFVGMATQEIAANQPGFIAVTLQETGGDINEVVVVGYGKQSKRNVSGAISTLTTDDIKRNPVADLSNTLAGRVTGVIA